WILDGLEVTVVGSIAPRLSEPGSGLPITSGQASDHEPTRGRPPASAAAALRSALPMPQAQDGRQFTHVPTHPPHRPHDPTPDSGRDSTYGASVVGSG
ncbi:hypothetical protein, partial [Streptomyces chartreusis]